MLSRFAAAGRSASFFSPAGKVAGNRYKRCKQ
jgi:hypothetical protein